MLVGVARLERRQVQVVRLAETQPSLELREQVCGRTGVPPPPEQDAALPVLLLPHGYSLVDEREAHSLMSELVLVRSCK